MKTKIIKMYLDYVNNFLTVAAFEDHYNLDFKKALRVLKIGKRLHIKSFK